MFPMVDLFKQSPVYFQYNYLLDNSDKKVGSKEGRKGQPHSCSTELQKNGNLGAALAVTSLLLSPSLYPDLPANLSLSAQLESPQKVGLSGLCKGRFYKKRL